MASLAIQLEGKLDPGALVTVTEMTDAQGKTYLHFVVEVSDTDENSTKDEVADLRAVFFGVSDSAAEKLLPGVTVANQVIWLKEGDGLVKVSQSNFATIGADTVTNLKGGSNLNGGGEKDSADFGVEFGSSPGMGEREEDDYKDDVRKAEFDLAHDTQSLTIANFLRATASSDALDPNFVVVRMGSVGIEYPRGGESAKLRGDFDDGKYTETPAAPTGSIGDTVWFDTDHDGQQDTGEAGVAGVTVNLLKLDENGDYVFHATTTTVANGTYNFNQLADGSYKVEFVAPDGRVFTTPNQGNDASDSDAGTAGTTDVITLGPANRNINTVDAGLVGLGTIGDRVWFDTDRDGLQSSGEKGAPGVTVKLYDASNTLIRETVTTSTDGWYQFTGLKDGDYTVKFVAPNGTTFTKTLTNESTAGGSDSDAGPTGTTGTITIDADHRVIDRVDAGLVTPVDPTPQPGPDRYDDLIEGGGGDDWILGGRGNDEMQGEGGDDVVVGGTDRGTIDASRTVVKIGDNLYGNGGKDTYLYAKGDGVDLIWDFNPGEDKIRLYGFTEAEAKAVQFAFVSGVENRIWTGSHDKVALVFNGGADGAIIFNDFPGPKAGDQAIEFVMADNTTVISYSTATLVDMAGKPGALRFGAASSTKGPDRDPTPSNGSGPSNPYGTPGDVVRGTDADNQLYVYDRAVTLVGEAGNDQLFGVNFGETFFGDAGDDIVYTNEGDDRAVGGSGNDKLYGAGGQDFIFGDDVDVSGYGLEFGTVLGNVPVRPAPEQALPTPTGDLLVTGEPTGPSEPVAGEPQPTLTVELFAVADIPSSEWDAYTFSEPADASEPAPAGYQISSAKGAVTIADFTSGVDDIYLFVGAFKKLGSASEDGTPLKKGCFVVNTTGLATKAGAQIIYEKDTGELYYDVDGKGGRKATHFATLEDCPNVSIHDFVLCL